MRKPTKRPDFSARAGNTIPLVVTRIVDAKNTPAANDTPKHGKLNYQGRAKPPKPEAPSTRRVERKSFATGRFVGDGQKLTAFVWLDEENSPAGEAAND